MIHRLLIHLHMFAANPSCTPPGAGFFGLPAWYKYLPSVPDSTGKCLPQIIRLSDVWLIGAAVIEILLRIASLAAIGFIVWGGIQFVLSQGEPDKAKKARETIFHALIGLAIAIAATTTVSFIAGRFNG